MTDARRALAFGGVAALALVLAFLSGRFSSPARVEERVRVEKVEVEKQVVVVEEKVRVETVERVRTVEVLHRQEREERRPDGTVVIERTEDARASSEAASASKSEGEASARAEAEKRTSESAASSTVRLSAPRWMVGATAGVSTRPLPSLSTFYGGQVAYRVAGPVWLGAQAQTSGHVGLTLALQF